MVGWLIKDGKMNVIRDRDGRVIQQSRNLAGIRRYVSNHLKKLIAVDRIRNNEGQLSILFSIFLVDTAFKRLALNMDQVEEHNPPLNPAKVTDTRAQAYIATYGTESWELDALDPIILSYSRHNRSA
jgi:hypothetical protein